MAEYIEKQKIKEQLQLESDCRMIITLQDIFGIIDWFPAADVVEVCRCQNCIYSVPFERNCELNSTAYMHCTLGRGEETLNVWHKYKKYYRDYSVVDRDGFCDEGERRAE